MERSFSSADEPIFSSAMMMSLVFAMTSSRALASVSMSLAEAPLLIFSSATVSSSWYIFSRLFNNFSSISAAFSDVSSTTAPISLCIDALFLAEASRFRVLPILWMIIVDMRAAAAATSARNEPMSM
ncbi:hypothetical protein CSUB_C0610 [Candidatus Caldarchaeum subterraneum]|uniref:Uncharacterized protein n=1 Tax=Caldiarchaeum subterraneum TaxID=311458 RepID=E6N5V8_CALS0|nr:hypothetical protein HGMM_F32D08C43 [Candidatus Caldarchaeum subterraneum]BAJ50469.1 hypothetical protein CSUB_C0610 [Candidatus Caldarchaeum subterraneum]